MNLNPNDGAIGFRHSELESEGVRARPLDVVFTKTELARWERNLRRLEERVKARRSWGSYAERAARRSQAVSA